MRRLMPLAVALTVAVSGALTACSDDKPGPAAGPDELTSMICENEVRQELKGFLGVDTAEAPVATWTAPKFTCVYKYADGQFTMTVWEEPDIAATEALYSGKSGGGIALNGLGEAAATLTDGSIVLRKDTKVLLIDVSGLPKQLGRPPVDPARAGLTIAQVVMDCWIEVPPSP